MGLQYGRALALLRAPIWQSSWRASELDLTFIIVKIKTDQIIATPVLADPSVLLCSNDNVEKKTRCVNL